MPTQRAWGAVAAALVVAAGVLLALDAGVVPVPLAGDGRYDDARVTVEDENGTTLATVAVRVADEPHERYVGLSETESLRDGRGMLFVYDDEATRHFVMRRMDFPLDMVFVGANHTVTRIHHAPTRENAPPGAEPYSGPAQWVLEVPRGYANETGIAVGDRVRIEYLDAPTPDVDEATEE